MSCLCVHVLFYLTVLFFSQFCTITQWSLSFIFASLSLHESSIIKAKKSRHCSFLWGEPICSGIIKINLRGWCAALRASK